MTLSILTHSTAGCLAAAMFGAPPNWLAGITAAAAIIGAVRRMG